MTAGRSERRPVKIRRRGRHTTPSQVERVAAQAGRAAPAVAIAGALVAVPHLAHAATTTAWSAASAAHQAGPAARATLESATARKAAAGSTEVAGSTHYTVRSGDTLSKIAGNFYHKTGDWPWLYHENRKRITDPDEIYPGESVYVPANPPANYTLPVSYQPRHAKRETPSGGGDERIVPQSAQASAGGNSAGMSGTLGCSGLERLWDAAGGNSSDAVIAASVAMAESGGNQYALSPTDDYGYWQINASNGSLATFNPYGNARAAIQLSNNGSDWSQWTTYTSGAYSGKC